MVGGERPGRREQLVEAAFRRVAEVGFEGLRLRQVAQDAGIDHSTLHHHFATKQELVEAVAAHATRQFVGTAPPGGGAAARLRGHLATLRTLMLDRPELFTVTAELDLRARRDAGVRAAMARVESGWREVLVGLLDGAVPAPEVAAELVIAAVKGVRLEPQHADAVFTRLEALLLGSSTERE